MTSAANRATRLSFVYSKSNALYPQTRFAFIVLAIAEDLPGFLEAELVEILDDSFIEKILRAMALKHSQSYIDKSISAGQLCADISKALQVTARFRETFSQKGVSVDLKTISQAVWAICMSGNYSRRYLHTIAGRKDSASSVGRLRTSEGPLSDLLGDLRINIKIPGAKIYFDVLEPEMLHDVTTYSFLPTT